MISIIYQNKEQGTSSRFLDPDSLLHVPIFYSFEISETFTQIRNKELIPGSRFPVPDSQFPMYMCSFDIYLAVFIIRRQITLTL